MRYRHQFVVNAPVDQVVAFHARSASLAAITPPPIIVRFQETPALLNDGDTMNFTLWIGPLPIQWSARLEQVRPHEFADHQIKGPFGSWIHRHQFIALEHGQTKVVDEIDATYGHKWWQQLVGRAMWSGMPPLFAYRAWRTRRLLARPEPANRSANTCDA